MSGLIKWLIEFVLKRVSVDQLIAYAVNWLLEQLLAERTKEYYEKVKQTLVKVDETLQVANTIMADDKVTEDEVTRARLDILRIWSAGLDSTAHRNRAKANLKAAHNEAVVEVINGKVVKNKVAHIRSHS